MTPTVTQVASAAVATTLLAANSARRGVTIVNTDQNMLRVKFGSAAAADSFSYALQSGQTLELPQPVYTGIITGIWDADGAGVAAITEVI